MVKNIAVHKFIGVVVFVPREKFTRKSIVDVRDSPYVEWETRRSVQTGHRVLGLLVDEISFTESGDVQVGEFVFQEVDISDAIIGTITADGLIRFSEFIQDLCFADPYELWKYENRITGSRIESLVCV